jgi:hypothetical protein
MGPTRSGYQATLYGGETGIKEGTGKGSRPQASRNGTDRETRVFLSHREGQGMGENDGILIRSYDLHRPCTTHIDLPISGIPPADEAELRKGGYRDGRSYRQTRGRKNGQIITGRTCLFGGRRIRRLERC